jgi:hypothetical protein
MIPTSWLAIITETNATTAKNFASFLMQKAERQKLKVTVIPYNNVEAVITGIKSRKPFAVSVIQDLPLTDGADVVAWGGLNILKTTAELKIPSVLVTTANVRQVQGALNQMKIQVKPTKIVSPDSPVLWADTMLSLLMTRPK